MASRESRSKCNCEYMVEIFKMAHKNYSSTYEDQWTAIQENWNHFGEEYCFKFVKSIFERIKANIKAWGGATKHPYFFVTE